MSKPENSEGATSRPVAHAHRLMVGGLWASGLYLAALGLYALNQWDAMLAMKPDQFATFLSGAFAPLAFLWLVLGFKQQGDELKNSAEALWLQGEELRNSVEQQRQLVEVSREQLLLSEAQRSEAGQAALLAVQPGLLPFIELRLDPEKQKEVFVSIEIEKNPCTYVKLFVDGKFKKSAEKLAVGQKIAALHKLNDTTHREHLDLACSYLDSNGVRHLQKFRFPRQKSDGLLGMLRFGEPLRLPVLPDEL